MVLGDGNLSFGLALARALPHVWPELRLVCSTFDGEDALLRKYPESAATLARLARLERVRVLHCVDATALHTHRAALPPACRAVLFNFPHLGVEDCALHASLLAHSMHAARGLLSAAPAGLLCIALSEEQCARWRLLDTAASQGLRLVERLPFGSADIPGYETKRHHNDKSFETRIGGGVCFCFRDEAHMSAPLAPNLFALLLEHYRATPHASAARLDDATPRGDKPPSRKRSKVGALTEGRYARVEEGGRVLFRCSFCAKCLGSEQGAMTHVYVEHLLSREGARPVRCEPCDREFAHGSALDAHRSTVHAFDIPKRSANVAVPPAETAADTPMPFACAVCLLSFASAEALAEHTRGVAPVDPVLALPCEECGRRFRDLRALGLHRAMTHAAGTARAQSALV